MQRNMIHEWLGDHRYYKFLEFRMRDHQRLGQAFMNALDNDSYNILTGSPVDPFYEDNWPAIGRALDYLLERA